jgi:Flp pilus assembly protein TadD
MKWALVMAAAPLALSFAGCGGASQQSGAAPRPVPTFNKDVAPIVFEHCAPCHRPGQAAPFTLLSYADAKSRADKIAHATLTRHMPPWPPASGEPAFIGERRLRDDQIDTIQRWAKGGAAEGSPEDQPKVPVWPEGWELGKPDVVVSPGRAYVLPPGDEDVYRNLVLRLSIPATRFVRAVEFRPGDAPVHHAVIHLDRSSGSRRRDAADGQPGFEGMGGPGTQDPDGHFVGWAPGRGPIVAPPAMPWRLEPGTDLVVELHLLPGKTPVPVRPTVALFFAEQPAVAVPAMLKMGSQAIDIPAGQRDYAITDSYVVPVDVDVLSVYPHAHFLGKEMQVRAVLPGGRDARLLHIPRWSFHWQQDYRYVQPVHLPRGTTVTLRFTYDNSDGNSENPHHPPVRVMAGQRSTDEMGNLLLQMVPRAAADRPALMASFARHEALANVTGAEMLVRHTPNDAQNQRLLGSSYADVGRNAEAIAHLEQALRLNPRLAEAHNDLGGVLLAERRIDSALAHFQQASALSPDDEHLHYNLGKVLAAVGRSAEAAREFERAIALNAEFAEAHDSLGVILFARNRIAEALVHFRRAAELSPDSPDIQNDLGGALAQAGHFADALRHVRRALELRPHFPAARENLERLQRVKR